jgi:hypothetical protein
MQPAGNALMAGLHDSAKAGYQDFVDWLSTLDPSQDISGLTGAFSAAGMPLGSNVTVVNVQPNAIQVNGVLDPVEVAKQVHAQFNEVINESVAQGSG